MTKGYAGTTVPQIAAAARVAVPTVYSSTGGKADILATLLSPIGEDPSAGQAAEAIAACEDPAEIVALLGHGTWLTHVRHWDIIVGLFPQCVAEPAAAELHRRILGGYQAAIGVVADRLAALGALRPGLDRHGALDLLWFYLGAGAWPALVRDRGWSLEQARDWLTAAATTAVLPDRP
ncbi:TetR/AcrR family transcriptional regulator [Actinoplanes sp. CA-054009]